MTDWLVQTNALIQALFAGIGTWLLTALGAAVVFLQRKPSPGLRDAMLGFAAGWSPLRSTAVAPISQHPPRSSASRS